MSLTLRCQPAATCSPHCRAQFRNRGSATDTGCSLRRPAQSLPRASRFRCAAEEGSSDGDESKEISSARPEYQQSSAEGDWRAFRARLVASETEQDGRREPSELWAHHVPGPEQGCLLLAHPLCFASQQQYFSQACILLFAHDERGSAGLILNRATERTLGSIKGADTLCPAFADSVLYLGGDVGESTYHVLHPYALSGAQEIMHNVHLGGFERAKAGIEAGELDPSRFKLLTRYSGWGPGQLQRECQAGVWLTAAASSSFVLQRDLEGDEMWHQALTLMGGDYLGLSKAVKGEDQQIFPPDGDPE